MHDAAGYIFQICGVGWIFFLLKPAGYWRNRQGIFLNGAGFKRDTGGVSQLMETQLAILNNSMIIEMYNDMFWIS